MIELGDYTLRSIVGSGSSGDVWLATDRRTDAKVAVKVGTHQTSSQDAYLRHFQHEIATQLKLFHPTITRLYDYGRVDRRAADQSDGELLESAPYFVMEFAERGTLRPHASHWSWSSLRSLLFAVLDALAYAHAREVVHRDLKPSNILRFDGPTPYKISDFGLALADDVRRTTAGDGLRSPVGTAHYMAPEQVLGRWRSIGPWTDLYALGCIALELVNGRRAFPGGEARQVTRAHLEQSPPSMTPRFEVPDGLGDWLDRMLAKSAHRRTPRAAIAAFELAQLPAEVPGHPPSDSAPPSTPADPETDAALQTEIIPTISLAETTRPDDALPSTQDPPEAPEATLPFPTSWRRPVDRLQTPDTSILPRSLFDARSLPMVGRERERQTLWELCARAVDTEDTRCGLVEGGDGVGKSRLVRWLSRRTHEAAGFITATAQFDDGPEVTEGLRQIFDELLHSWGLEGDDLRRHLLELVQAGYIAPADDEDAEAFADFVGRTLDSWTGAPVDQTRPRPVDTATRRERYGLLTEVLSTLARNRPVLVVLEDVHALPDAVEFLDYLLEAEPAAPLVVVATHSADPKAARNARRMIDDLRARPTVESLELQPLSMEAHRRLLDSLAPLEEELRETLVRTTRGNPFFAIETIRDWSARDLLRPTDAGLTVPEDQRQVPRDIRRFWARRVQTALDGLPDGDVQAARAGLQIAATLGRSFDEKQWQVACRKLGLEPPHVAFTQLVERGILRLRVDGWAFSHPLLVEVLRQAPEPDARRRIARACIAAVEDATDDDRFARLMRRTRLLAQADQLHDALQACGSAMEAARVNGIAERVRTALEMRESLMDELAGAEQGRYRVENWLYESRMLLDEGDHEEASALIDHVVAFSTDEAWPELHARGMRLRAYLARARGDFEASREALLEAKREFDAIGAEDELADCLHKQGVLEARYGNYDAAQRLYRKSAELFAQCGHTARRLESEHWAIYPKIYRGELDEARSLAEELLEEAVDRGCRRVERGCRNQLGEIARFRGRFDDARTHYRAFRELSRSMGQLQDWIAEMNLAFVDVGDGRFARARQAFEALEETVIENGHEYVLPSIRAGRMAALAGLKRWESFDEARRTLETTLEAYDGRERDAAWLIDMAAQLARRRDHLERAERISELLASFPDYDTI